MVSFIVVSGHFTPGLVKLIVNFGWHYWSLTGQCIQWRVDDVDTDNDVTM